MTSLLVEIQTEELPPKALRSISEAFAKEVEASLDKQGFFDKGGHVVTPFGSPRRIAVHISDVLEKTPDKQFAQRLVPVKVGKDKEGKPTPALQKKLKALGLTAEIEDLVIENDGKQDQFYYVGVKPGINLQEGLQEALNEAVHKLPVPKMMSYQLEDGRTVEFVRPVKSVAALYGSQIIEVELFGHKAGRTTQGHRFHSKMPIEIEDADSYSKQLVCPGHVMPFFEARKHRMMEQLDEKAKVLDSEIIEPEDLVEEVAALTEWPVVYESEFDEDFLSVPEECLILTMQHHQKYFALRDKEGNLTNKFLVVSQLEATDGGKEISSGNARVVRARLADAKFFYEQDKLETLESRIPKLEKVVYHNKLGNQLDRSKRIEKIASKIAQKIGADPKLAARAASLAKTDLLTQMVGEFPELQGIMGEYYALHDGENPLVAKAIKEHYQPRYAGDELPSTPVSISLALADKMDTLTGLFGIGQIPTGDKDPFALRRHAVGVLRMLIEKQLPISLDELIKLSFDEEMTIPGVKDASKEVKDFFFDRLRVLLRDTANKEDQPSVLEVESVLAVEPEYLRELPKRLNGVRTFMKDAKAKDLAEANKRIENILKKNSDKLPEEPDRKLMTEEAEIALANAIENLNQKIEGKANSGQYTELFEALTEMKAPVSEFFDNVMVNTDDPAVRLNRLALLDSLHKSMNQVARLSCLVPAK